MRPAIRLVVSIFMEIVAPNPTHPYETKKEKLVSTMVTGFANIVQDEENRKAHKPRFENDVR